METLYTPEQNALTLITLMKSHNIRKVVASPGSTNVCIVTGLQRDPFFELYSAADERSESFILASGLAEVRRYKQLTVAKLKFLLVLPAIHIKERFKIAIL